MPVVQIHTQQFQDQNHEQLIQNVFEITNPIGFIICSAFVNSDGVIKISEQLLQNHNISTVYVGIRNGVTSIQGLFELLRTGVTIYTIDTATVGGIFHSKIYCGYTPTAAKIIIGSANLTFGGLTNNIETSCFIDLNLETDREVLNSIITVFSNLHTDYPQNVVRLNTSRDAVRLLHEGRIIDERKKKRIIIGSRSTSNTGAIIPRINLNFQTPIRVRRRRRITRILPGVIPNEETPIALPSDEIHELVWNLPALRRRHLQIPDNPNTNVTGTLSLTQGSFEHIDHTTYFREIVFRDAVWGRDERNQNNEIAYVNFDLIVLGVLYGTFNLKVSHNPGFEAGQRNYTSSLHWGVTRTTIAREELLDCELNLYRKNNSNDFIISID